MDRRWPEARRTCLCETQSANMHRSSHKAPRLALRMLAAARAAVPELARGVSTALSLAAHRCPPCACNPSLTCGEAPRCPDCVCHGTRRACPPGAGGGVVWWGICGVLFALLLGFAAGWRAREWLSRPAVPSESSPRIGASRVAPLATPREAIGFGDAARLQALEIRHRQHEQRRFPPTQV